MQSGGPGWTSLCFGPSFWLSRTVQTVLELSEDLIPQTELKEEIHRFAKEKAWKRFIVPEYARHQEAMSVDPTWFYFGRRQTFPFQISRCMSDQLAYSSSVMRLCSSCARRELRWRVAICSTEGGKMRPLGNMANALRRWCRDSPRRSKG